MSVLDNPIVSVLLAVKNEGPYLAEAINSLLSQSVRSFEVLAVDDGSTDETGTILEAFASLDPRIKPIHLPNSVGLSAALNIAFGRSRGRYIARHDGDDISAPDRFERQLEVLESRPAVGLLGTSGSYFRNGTNADTSLVCPTEHSQIVESITARKRSAAYIHASWMLRRECMERVGEYSELFFGVEDKDYLLRVSEQFEVANLSAPLYRFRIHEGSVTSSGLRRRRIIRRLVVRMYMQRQETGVDALGTRRATAFTNSSIAQSILERTLGVFSRLDSSSRLRLLREVAALTPSMGDAFTRALASEILSLAIRRG